MLSRKIWLYFSSVVAVICILAPLSSADTISCSSDDMHRHYCSANTRGGVQLVKQRSEAQCIQGQTWGYDQQGIWVDGGCRADFSTGGGYGNGGYGNDGYGGGDSQLVNCSSDDGHRHACQIDGNGGRVRLSKQRSGSPCIEGSTWGYSDREIWVDRGCRADFTVEARYDRGGHGGYGRNGGGDSQLVNCSSDDGHRHACQINGNGGRVRLSKQRSGSPCIEGSTWGYNDREIWVDRGCRADFTVEARYDRGGYGGDDSQLVNCSSDDGHRHSCQIDGNGGRVRLSNQRSGSPCIEGSTWGYNDREIWVDRGCRADFTVEARYDRGGHGGYGDNGGGQADQFLNCSSEDGHRKYCPADTRGRVQMVKQRSGSECREGYSWGYDRGGVWVDHGCRADFQIVK